MALKHGDDDALVSYRTLRRLVGLLGVTLPFILEFWGFALCHCGVLQPSISDYYGLRTRDAFVGILFTIAWFLFTYRGYGWKDDIAGNLACVFALGVALFPNSGANWERTVHFTSATLLFLVLSYYSLFLFTKSSGVRTAQKKIRNRIYIGCGVAILICIALIGLYYSSLQDTSVARFKPVFWLESFALVAFGISWFIKGETLWTDPGPSPRAVRDAET